MLLNWSDWKKIDLLKDQNRYILLLYVLENHASYAIVDFDFLVSFFDYVDTSTPDLIKSID